MKTITIQIENLKCQGCASTIKKEMKKIDGVSNVTVSFDDPAVVIEYEGDESLKDKFISKLAKIGYPLRGNKNLGNQIKSYVSCAIGRMSKEEQE